MSVRTRLGVLAACFLLTVGHSLFSQPLFINELLASNSGGLADEAGEFDDWVELYNAGTTPVNIAGMFLTDDLSEPDQWKIPASDPAATTIPAGGFLLIWFDKQMSQGALHVDAKLGADGEAVGLFAADGSPIDALTFGPQTANVSYGRSPDGGDAFQFFNQPSPKGSNNLATGGDFAEAPIASQTGGFFNANFSVSLASATPGAKIRYTLDGSEPSDNSALYTAPVVVSQTTTLRARAFATGYLPSAIATHTYIISVAHSFPVVALSFNEADFFDPATGIYPNYLENWERLVHVEFFDEDGNPGFSQAAVTEIHGTASAEYAQKSLKIKAVANAGSGFFQYPLFPERPFEEYKSFLLRNSGQDWNITMFRDAFVTSLVGDLTDVGDLIQRPDLHLQAFRPGVTYLNGKYWGIHNLRENMDEGYIEAHTGLKDHEIDFLENDSEAKAGDFDNWNGLLAWLGPVHFGNDDRMAEYAQWVNMPHFLDYNVFNLVVDNGDWPGNNNRRWRKKANGSQWEWMSFDLDFSFGLLDFEPDTMLWNTGDASANSIVRALDSTSTGWPNQFWMTLPFRKAMQNAAFRRDFANRSADFLNVLFDPDRVNARLDEFEQLYAPEIGKHLDRWSPGWNVWHDNIAVMRHFAEERPHFFRQHIVETVTGVTGTATVTLRTEPADAGSLYFSTLKLDNDRLPWSGEYFTGIEIPVTAAPERGFVFTGWSDAAMSSAAVATTKMTADKTLVAFFEKGSTATDAIVINEINYNSPDNANPGDWVELYNPNTHAVDLSGWVFEDESGEFFSFPANSVMLGKSYLVLVENEADFLKVYPAVFNRLGDFGGLIHGFKLGNGGELIQLKNANLDFIDSVPYDDGLPWNPDADGSGATLQLLGPLLDNALAASWKAAEPTPGKPNVANIQTQTIDFQNIGNQLTTATPITLLATASSGLPVAFTVVNGPATLSGNVLTLTGAEGIVTLKASQPGDANWLTAPDVFKSFSVKKPSTYCTAKGERPWWAWIERVEFGDIDHLSFKTPFGNFINTSTSAPMGETMALTITPAFSWQVFNEYFRAWIDFNRDGDFDDPGEMVLEGQGSGKVSADVFIPLTASTGVARMRVAMKQGGFPGACEHFDLGEVEDYSLVISPDGILSPGGGQGAQQLVVNLFPNPTADMVSATFETLQAGAVMVKIVSDKGVEVQAETLHLQEGSHLVEMDVSDVASGTYMMVVLPKGQRPIAGGFVKAGE